MRPWEGAESRCVPRARIPVWISTGELFEGTGTSGVAVVLDPDPQAVGIFFCLLAAVCLCVLLEIPRIVPCAMLPTLP
jgi:hypothetical protein